MIKDNSLYIFLKNFFVVLFWFVKKKNNTSVIFFEVPSSLLLSHLDLDVKKTVSIKIEEIKNCDFSNVDNDTLFEDDKYYHIKRVFKIAWLIKSLKENGNKNPIQLLQSENGKYFCHPGTDRSLILTYIDPVDTINGFYIWYHDLDPNPFLLDFNHEIIKNPFTFLSKFKFNKNLSFRKIKMNKFLDVSDKLNSNAMFLTAKNCFEKIQKEYSVDFLSYYDNTQWKELRKEFTLDNYVKISEEEITLIDIKFKKLKGMWIPQYD